MPEQSGNKKPAASMLAGLVVVSLLFLSSCALSGLSPFAYPHAWDFTRSRPKDADLVGTYKLLKISGSLRGFRESNDTRITLNADHSAVISGIPEYDVWGENLSSLLSGKGTWEVQDNGETTLEFFPSKNVLEAPRTSFGNIPFWVLGQRPPYRLYLCIGDPDNDTGIELQRR